MLRYVYDAIHRIGHVQRNTTYNEITKMDARGADGMGGILIRWVDERARRLLPAAAPRRHDAQHTRLQCMKSVSSDSDEGGGIGTARGDVAAGTGCYVTSGHKRGNYGCLLPCLRSRLFYDLDPDLDPCICVCCICKRTFLRIYRHG